MEDGQACNASDRIILSMRREWDVNRPGQKNSTYFLVLKHGGTGEFAFSIDFEKSFPCTHSCIG